MAVRLCRAIIAARVHTCYAHICNLYGCLHVISHGVELFEKLSLIFVHVQSVKSWPISRSDICIQQKEQDKFDQFFQQHYGCELRMSSDLSFIPMSAKTEDYSQGIGQSKTSIYDKHLPLEIQGRSELVQHVGRS